MSRFERGIFHKDKLPDPSVAIIYNNGAGDARKARQYKQATDETAARLREHYGLFVPDYTPTRSAKEAEDLVGKAIEEQRGLIIVKGGDGTYFFTGYNGVSSGCW